MKSDKKELHLHLVPVEAEKPVQIQENVFKSMSLSDLLAALELILEVEKENKESSKFDDITVLPRYWN